MNSDTYQICKLLKLCEAKLFAQLALKSSSSLPLKWCDPWFHYSIPGQDVFCNTEVLVVGGCKGTMTLGAHSWAHQPSWWRLWVSTVKKGQKHHAGRIGNKKSEKQHKKHWGPKEELLCGRRDFPSSPLRTCTGAEGLYSPWATWAWGRGKVGERRIREEKTLCSDLSCCTLALLQSTLWKLVGVENMKK